MITGADWFLKLLYGINHCAGYKGGEVTPLFSIGASLGVWLAPFFGLPVLSCSDLGLSLQSSPEQPRRLLAPS
ncbi:MAG: hypothetical protein ACLRSL_05335 [Streptococcus sp.]